MKGFFYILIKNPQLIISYYFLPRGIFGIIYGIFFRKKVVTCIIGTDIKYLNHRFFGKIFRIILSHSTIIISTGSKKKKILDQVLYSFSKNTIVKIIPNTIETNKDNRGLENILKRPNQFIYVGRIDENKRLEIILKSFRLFLDNVVEKKSYRLIIIGDGVLLENMKQLKRKLNLNNNCRFLGFQEDISNYYKQSKFILLASKSEGLPAVLIEGLNYGCIPITTNAGDIEDLVNNSNGFLISNKLQKDALITSFYRKIKLATQLNEIDLLKMSNNCINTTLKFSYAEGGIKWRKLIKSLI